MDDQVPAPQGPAPRLLVRKKNERNGRHASNGESSPYGNGQGPYPQRPGMPPIEDRELHYEKARARIFGEGGMPMQGYPQQPGAAMMAYPYGVGMAPMSPVSPRAIPGAPGPGPFPAGPMPQRSSGGPSGPPMHRGNDRGMERNDRSGGGYSGGGGGGGGGRGKAQLRNRQEDMSDPDFRRGRLGPRFDPGFGEDAPHGGMYYHPTYSSEFPTLATGPAGVHDAPSPRGGGAAGYSGNGASAGAMGYAGGYPPAMLAAPMGQYGYGQGMMAPGMVPVAMGSNGLGGMPMYQGGGMAYPGAYMTPMGPYGYIPMRPGPDGMVPHGVMPMPMHGGAYMQNGMGGVPMSPTAAGMAGLPSPGSNKGRSRRNGTGSRGSSSAANTPRAASLPSPARQSSQQSTDLIAAVAEEGAR